MRRSWCLVAAIVLQTLLAGLAPAKAETETPKPTPQGQVTLPLDTFLDLSRKPAGAGPGASNPVPVPYMFSKGLYRLSASGGWAQVQGSVTLQVYQAGWVEVPLMPADVVLSRASLDGQGLALYRKDGQFFFPIDRPGAHRLEATWHLPMALDGATRRVVLKTPPSSVSQLIMTLPGREIEVSTSPTIPLHRRDEGGRLQVEGTLPGGQAGPVTLSWKPLRADPALRGRVNHEKARITGRIYDLVTILETSVQSRIRVDYTILRNEVDRFTLRVPASAEVEDVVCDNLASWSEQVRGLTKEILVRLSTPASGSQTLKLVLVQPLTKIDSTWTLPALEVVGAERVKGSIGVGSSGGIEVQPGVLKQVRAIDVSELPTEVRQDAGFALLRAFEFHRQPWSVSLTTRKGQELPLLTAAMDRAEGLTLVTGDGKRVTRFAYQVRNNGRQSLSLRLPQGSTLFTATLDGQPTRPVQGPDGELRVSLVASGQGGQQSFPVEITYIEEPGGAPLGGRHRLQAPRVDLPVSVMNWTVYLPLEQWVYHIGGDMRPGWVQEAPEVPALPQEAAAPGASDEPKSRSKDKARALRREVDQEEVLGDSRMSQMIQQASRGTLPVKFSIPARGQSFQFSRLVVTDGEQPQVTLHFYSGTLQIVGAVLALGLTLAWGLPRTRRPAGLEPLGIATVALWVVGAWAGQTPLAHLLLWMNRGLYLLLALWLYRNRAWILARLQGRGGEP